MLKEEIYYQKQDEEKVAAVVERCQIQGVIGSSG